VAKRDGLSLTGDSQIVTDRRENCKKNHDVPATMGFEKPTMPDHALQTDVVCTANGAERLVKQARHHHRSPENTESFGL
jgi:hypothetical protein